MKVVSMQYVMVGGCVGQALAIKYEDGTVQYVQLQHQNCLPFRLEFITK